MSREWVIGIIGGSGANTLDGLDDPQWIAIESPFGEPSDELLCGRIGRVQVRFLPRHGRGHRLPPDAVNARANVDVLKRAGCTDILATSSVGSLGEALLPGALVAVDQFIDCTRARPASFFGPGFVAHVDFAEPVCPRLSAFAADAAQKAGGMVHGGATYLAVDGPQFPTQAERRLYRQWGADVIGMTAMPEARLAREAELPYALLAMVSHHPGGSEGATTLVRNLGMRAALHLIDRLPAIREPSPIDRALDRAVITRSRDLDPELAIRLGAVAGRWLDQR